MTRTTTPAITLLTGILSVAAAIPIAKAQPAAPAAAGTQASSSRCKGDEFSLPTRNGAGGMDAVLVNVKAGTATVNRDDGRVTYSVKQSPGYEGDEDFSNATVLQNPPQSGDGDISETPDGARIREEVMRAAWRWANLCSVKG